MSVTPFTSAGLSGSAGSAASRSHSTRSADCACASDGAQRRERRATIASDERLFMTAQVASTAPANSRLEPDSRAAPAPTSGEARNRSSRSAAAALSDAAMRPAENTAGVCSSRGIGPTTSMPATCFSSLICCTARSASPVTSRSAVKPCGMITRLRIDLGGDAQPLDQLRETGCRWRRAANRPPTRAPSSVARSAASVAMSGWAAPAFTAMPT